MLDKFKKANKVRRQKLAEQAGYATAEEYMKVLTGETSARKTAYKVAKNNKIINEYVIAFDTTGSMASYIDSVKKHVKTLIPTLFKNMSNLKMKVIAFGDYCDMTSANSFGKAYQESAFTNDENTLISFVTKAQNTNGGDGDEFYELVIKKITEETPWTEGSNRTVLFIGDYTPHKVGYSCSPYVINAQIDWKVEARKAAAKNIKFDTLRILDYTSSWYKELSAITNGTSLPFKNANKTSDVIEASMYASGAVAGDVTAKMSFTRSMATAMAGTDEELKGMYKKLNQKL